MVVDDREHVPIEQSSAEGVLAQRGSRCCTLAFGESGGILAATGFTSVVLLTV